MLAHLISILLMIGVVALVVYLVETYFPRLTKLWKIMLIASIVVLVIKIIHAWVCGWLCSPDII